MVSLATWLLFTGMHAQCVVFCVRCAWRLGSCPPMRPLGVLCCVCGVLGHVAPVHWSACSVCRVCGVLGDLAPFHWCAQSLCFVVCLVSLTIWFQFTGVPARSVVLRVQCPWPLGSCSPVCTLAVLCCVRGVPGPLGSRSVACTLGVLCLWCLCVDFGLLVSVHQRAWFVCCGFGVLGHLAPVHRCTRSARCVACAASFATLPPFTAMHAWCAVCAVSLATWLLFTGVHAWRVAFCVCQALDLLAPVHRRARVACGACRVLGHVALVHGYGRLLCCVPVSAGFVCVTLVLVWGACVLLVLCA